MKQLYIIRHGQSTANAQKIVCGQQDLPLTDLGRQQARAVAELARPLNFQLIVSSPMVRTLETARIIAEVTRYHGELLVLEGLKERSLGVAEGSSYSGQLEPATDIPSAEGIEGIEPIDAFYQRVKQAYDTIAARPEERILIVGHNGVGRMLRTIIADQPPLASYKMARLENATLYQLFPVV